jgi:hypothetical protein
MTTTKNKCKTCGCDDTFMVSPAPCPTPVGCPTPQPCSEIFDAQCVRYTGLPLSCAVVAQTFNAEPNPNPVPTGPIVNTNDTVAEALESIVDYICTETIVSTDIECDTDVVVESGTTVTDALVDIVDYFCNNTPAPGYTYEIGQYVEEEGGVIFHRYKDGANENYLVVGIQDNSSNVVWDSRSMFSPSIPNTSNLWDGLANTQGIVAGGVPLPNAAIVAQASNLPPSPLQDWYLPAIDELSILWQNRFNVNRTLSGNSSYGSIIGATQIGYNNYWSSTQINATAAWAIIFVPGSSNYGFYSSGKSASYYVRAIRKFSI